MKTIFNPFTGKPDYITVLSSSTLPSGTTNYIQNTFTPTTDTQVFSVQQGKYSYLGFIMTDINNCLWDTQINTNGAIVTTIISCPAPAGSSGTCMGLLCALTYP